MTAVDLAKLQIGDLTPHVDQVFEMQTASGIVPLKLTKVVHAGESGRAGGAFSLMFVAPPGPWHPQSIYPVAYPPLGTMEIFLVPNGPLSGGNSYYAVFT